MHNNSDTSIDAHSRVMFNNNSAHRGGAVYVQNLAFIRVDSDSYRYNFAKDSMAMYVHDQRCFFTFNSHSSRVLFEENSAKKGVGMHIYGCSIKLCINNLCN